MTAQTFDRWLLLYVSGVLLLCNIIVVILTVDAQQQATAPFVAAKKDTADAEFVNLAQDRASHSSENVLFRPVCRSRLEFVRPGDMARACNSSTMLTMRFWQPYRALRRVICDQTAPNPLLALLNKTEYADAVKALEQQQAEQRFREPQCADVYEGAECVQKYQQFLMLVNLGVSSSGWACVELESACDCSIKPLSQLKRPQYVQFLIKPSPPKPG